MTHPLLHILKSSAFSERLVSITIILAKMATGSIAVGQCWITAPTATIVINLTTMTINIIYVCIYSSFFNNFMKPKTKNGNLEYSQIINVKWESVYNGILYRSSQVIYYQHLELMESPLIIPFL